MSFARSSPSGSSGWGAGSSSSSAAAAAAAAAGVGASVGGDTFLSTAPKKKRNMKGLQLSSAAFEHPRDQANEDDEMHLQDTQDAVLRAALRGGGGRDDSSAAANLVQEMERMRIPIGQGARDAQGVANVSGSSSGSSGSSGSSSRRTGPKLTLPSRAAPPNPLAAYSSTTTGGTSLSTSDRSSSGLVLVDDDGREILTSGSTSGSRGGGGRGGGASSSTSGGGDFSPLVTAATQAPVVSSTTKKTRSSKASSSGGGASGSKSRSRDNSSSLGGANAKMDLKNEDFKVLGDLGAGNGGTVMRVMHQATGTIMARKLVLIDAKPSVRKQILRELQIMHDCSSPWIVSFYGAFLSDPHICICMEEMDRGSLDTIYKTHGAIRIEIVGKIAEAVLEGLTYLYDVHRIIHRDIKPSNILVNSKGKIKICDFGVSGELINSIANTFVGTSTYMSPERIQGGNYSVKSDVWSLGISLIELALGRFPFADDDLVDSDDDSDLRALRGGEDAEGTIQPGGGRRLDPAAAVADQETKRERRKSQGVSLGGGGTTMSILDLLQHIVNEPAPTLTPVTAFPAEAHAFVKDCLSKDPKDRKTPQELLTSPWMTQVKASNVDLEAWASGLAPAHAS